MVQMQPHTHPPPCLSSYPVQAVSLHDSKEETEGKAHKEEGRGTCHLVVLIPNLLSLVQLGCGYRSAMPILSGSWTNQPCASS